VPETPKKVETNTYHGVTVEDEYRWLEDGTVEPVRKWSDGQNAVARSWLDAIPERNAILDRVTRLTQSVAPLYYSLKHRSGAYFALKEQPPKQQSLLVLLGSVDYTGGERVLVDPNVLDLSGSTSIDFYVPSHDGSKVAVSMSRHGTEDGTVSVWDVATGKKLPDVLPGVNGGTAGGSVAWTADGTGFWRTRYPRKGERPDEDLMFYEQKIAEIFLESSKDGRYVLANILNGDGGEHEYRFAGPDGAFKKISRFEDEVVRATFATDAVYLLSRKGAPNGRILRLSFTDALAASGPEDALARATQVVAEGPTAIDGLVATDKRLYVADIVGGPNEVRIFTAGGEPLGKLPLPAVTTVNEMVPGTGDEILLYTESFTEPDRWLRFDPPALAGRVRGHGSAARVRDFEGRNDGPDHDPVQARHTARRVGPGFALRLRRLRDQHEAFVLARAPAVDRAGG
jgi:prolyl oligopeptidase